MKRVDLHSEAAALAKSGGGSLPPLTRPTVAIYPWRRFYRNVAKRGIDIAFTLMISPLLLPLTGILALIVMRDGHGAFYVQERVGRSGRSYRMWKLRSMVHDADAVLEVYLAEHPEARAEWDRHQKLSCDPRITRIGRVLRAFSLDELPQFWNVLTGDMSLVGPRPMTPEQRSLYPGDAYYRLRPGLTGPWQVSVRHTSGFADRAAFDDSYEAQFGLLTDIALILATIGVILRGSGS